MIRKGDIVTIKPEWMDKGDERLTFVARGDERDGYVDISSIESYEVMAIWPSHTTRVSMLTRDGRRLTAEGDIVNENGVIEGWQGERS